MVFVLYEPRSTRTRSSSKRENAWQKTISIHEVDHDGNRHENPPQDDAANHQTEVCLLGQCDYFPACSPSKVRIASRQRIALDSSILAPPPGSSRACLARSSQTSAAS